MLKGKALTILISTISLFVGLAAAAVGATFAWYSTHTADTRQLELNANGVLVLYFDDEEVQFTGSLKPAVSAKYKATENVTSFDVLTVNANITEAATTATATTVFNYLNSSAADPELSGKIGGTVTVTSAAKIVMSDSSERELKLGRDLTVLATFSVDYIDTTLTDFVPVDGGDNPLGIGDSFHVDGDCHISISVTIYFPQPDDLIRPDILEADKLIINLTSTVDQDD